MYCSSDSKYIYGIYIYIPTNQRAADFAVVFVIICVSTFVSLSCP